MHSSIQRSMFLCTITAGASMCMYKSMYSDARKLIKENSENFL